MCGVYILSTQGLCSVLFFDAMLLVRTEYDHECWCSIVGRAPMIPLQRISGHHPRGCDLSHPWRLLLIVSALTRRRRSQKLTEHTQPRCHPRAPHGSVAAPCQTSHSQIGNNEGGARGSLPQQYPLLCTGGVPNSTPAVCAGDQNPVSPAGAASNRTYKRHTVVDG